MSYKIFTAAILGVALLTGTAASAKTTQANQPTRMASHTPSRDKTTTSGAIKVAHRTHRLHLAHLRHAHKLHLAGRTGHALVKANMIQKPVKQANTIAHRERHATAHTATPSVIR